MEGPVCGTPRLSVLRLAIFIFLAQSGVAAMEAW